AIDLAKKQNADLVIANDPDSDRLGIEVANNGKIVQLSGNEVGILLCDYVLSQRKAQGTLPQNPIIVKTIVTSAMVDKVANNYGSEVTNVLTGFKYIGDVINKLEDKGEQDRYVFGFEESCGYLAGSYVRDKDGVIAAVLIAECAAYYKKQGKTLCDRLEELYDQYGHYLLQTISYRFEGVDGSAVKQKLLNNIRSNPLTDIAGSKVVDYCDFTNQRLYDLPNSDVMRFNAEGGSQLIIRPSGTEPLIKCYICVCGNKQSNDKSLADIKQQLNKLFA
ncbi:MAG: phospho-sugar mutase, partial [Clostridia bacterium]|nr:phospho-sugar mutase [Clostridia bacterium]